MAASLSLKARALRHLARREHSRAELGRKLATPAAGAARTRRQGHGDDLGDDLSEPQDEALLREQIARTLDELAARGLLSDERTAQSLLAGRGQRFGSRRLKQTLQAKGLAAELVGATLRSACATEFERALALWQRRFGAVASSAADASSDPSDPSTSSTSSTSSSSSSSSSSSTCATPTVAAAAERARQMRFLAARGFDPDIVRRVVKGETEG